MTTIHKLPKPAQMGTAASSLAGKILTDVLDTQGSASMILATGTSQFEMLKRLIVYPDIDWSKVKIFHLDEYIGIPSTHPASFRKYLIDRVISKIPSGEFFEIHGDSPDPHEECLRLSEIISANPVHLAMIGIGENGHIAFNDPPADFDTKKPYIVVNLDQACRNQQVGEGWFTNLAEVPSQAITMSVRQIMKSQHIICTVPDQRKAPAVQAAVEGPITVDCPASILRTHESYHLFLDEAAASLLAD